MTFIPEHKLSTITLTTSNGQNIVQPSSSHTRTNPTPSGPLAPQTLGITTSLTAQSSSSPPINPSSVFPVPAISTPEPPPPKNPNPDSSSSDNSDEGLLAGLFKIFLEALKIPTQFDTILSGVTNAGLALATGIGGLTQTTFLGLQDVVVVVIAIYTFLAKYFDCFINFVVTLPQCFISHVLTCMFSILYLIFPLTAWIIWMLTGFDLMPYFEDAFDHIADGDDMFAEYTGFNFLKLPPAIIKTCYTCHGETLRLKDIIKDALKIKDVGDLISHDATKTVPQYMAPAMPYLNNTAAAVSKLFG